ncbi:hypothetical protein Syun_030205 [Stephania yunnanensis]|uniref:FAD-binding FR-type domain-containing protein n=1 Tax=Stephania yunnanensis TaxID=152371 RepID=A0AAP0HKK9_9MAGN
MDSSPSSANSHGSRPNTNAAKRGRAIRAILLALFAVVFTGWLMIWVLLPTKTYKNSWTPHLKAKLNATFFGAQGTNLLIFTFPIMFIAAFSCVYLHMGKANTAQAYDSSASAISFLRRPIFVKPPLGIVTTMELMFAAMFLALLIWSLANYLYISFGNLRMHGAGEKVWQAKFRSVSLRLGYIGNVCMAFLFFPVTRGSSILPLVGLTSESSIKYHIWLGHLSMALFTAHSVGFIIYWAMTSHMSLMLQWSQTYVSNIAGEIAIVVAVVMWATSFPRVRRKMFELFFYTHQLYGLYIFFYVLHVGIAYFCMILPGIFLFLIDRYLRFLQSWQNVRLVSARILPCQSLELNFSKVSGLRYTPASILFINIPSISKLQWHPFTVTSNCDLESDRLSVVIKCEGSWSQKLYNTLSSPNPVERLDVSVEGPYGPTSADFLRHESLVMVTGGSGITAMISIIKEIINMSKIINSSPNEDERQRRHCRRVLLLCAFKNASDLSMLDLLLPLCSNTSPTNATTLLDISHIDLKIEAYITREPTVDESAKNDKNLLHAIWFKPKATDAPITAPLGRNAWLWLGAIISSSFTMFLLFLGILTRYYIYPIDHNTDAIYHYSGRCLWDMLIICVCVVLVASVAFMWNKRQVRAGRNAKQVMNTDVQMTPTASPSNWFGQDYNNGYEQELEGLPSQSLVHATRVHFGARPDLKRIITDFLLARPAGRRLCIHRHKKDEILLNLEGSSIGVMVCGPRKMRHCVAKICSSGLANNLHFEAGFALPHQYNKTSGAAAAARSSPPAPLFTRHDRPSFPPPQVPCNFAAAPPISPPLATTTVPRPSVPPSLLVPARPPQLLRPALPPPLLEPSSSTAPAHPRVLLD